MSLVGRQWGNMERQAFPSPCGVRRVRDKTYIFESGAQSFFRFPSPCGVRRVRDTLRADINALYVITFPSPCGVRRVRDSQIITIC